jgi:hypothetical protein
MKIADVLKIAGALVLFVFVLGLFRVLLSTSESSHRSLASPSSTGGIKVASFSPTGEIKVVEDRFNGYTSIDLPYLDVPSPSIRNTLEVHGFFISAHSGVTFSLTSKSEEWKYLECHQTSFLVDGKPFNAESLDYSGTVGSGHVLEFFNFFMPYSSFVKLANGQSVEFKICNDEYSLDAQHINVLRELASLYPMYH